MPEIVLFVPGDLDSSSSKNLEPIVDRLLVAPPEAVSSTLLSRGLRKLRRRLPWERSSSSTVGRYLQDNGIDVIFTTRDYGPNCPIPVLAEIPDFQHIRLPHMFAGDEIAGRDILYRNLARHAVRIVVSSQDNRREFEEFAPKWKDKVRVVPFAAGIEERLLSMDPAACSARYNLPEKFFFMPNQFWKHKNHMVVLDALAIASRKNDAMTVVFSGNMKDYRHPDYFNGLLQEISYKNVRKNVALLGLVPYDDVFQLMRRSIAVLQPSLFEGLSITLAEAKSLGRPVVLSDIPVLRELGPPTAHFFDPHDPEALAGLLLELYGRLAPGPDQREERAAVERSAGLVRAFGHSLLEIIREATTTV
jgi:glycosyltransferase involved in cell wall biosynthesis